MNNINVEGFLKAFIKTRNNMTTKDFLDNGYTMEHFIRYANAHDTMDYEEILKTYKKIYFNDDAILDILSKG